MALDKRLLSPSWGHIKCWQCIVTRLSVKGLNINKLLKDYFSHIIGYRDIYSFLMSDIFNIAVSSKCLLLLTH